MDSRTLMRSQLSLNEETDDASETYTEIISDKEVATFKVTQTQMIVEKEIFFGQDKLERSLFFKTLGMNTTKHWSQEHNEIEARKNFSIFDCHNSNEKADYLCVTLARVARRQASQLLKLKKCEMSRRRDRFMSLVTPTKPSW